MSFLSRPFTGAPESRSIRLESIPRWSEASMDLGYGPDGNALNLVSVFACVRLLSDSVSALPLRAFRKRGEIRVLAKPQPKLLQSTPYPGIVWRDWLWMVMQSLAITGNAFLLVTARGEDGRPTSLLPVNPNSIQVEIPDERDWTSPIFRVGGKVVSSADIVHIKRFPVAGAAVSLSPVELAASTIDLGLAANKYGLRYFRDSANPSGILSTEAELSEDQVKQNMRRWVQTHGRGKRYPAILGGGLKWQPISITPEESQFLATRAFQRSEIAMLFGIPPHMIGDIEKQTSYGSGVEQQAIGFVVNTLRPWLECIEQVFNELLPNGQYVKFGIDALLRGDFKARQEGYQIAIQSGYLSVNEVRALEDREPIPNGNIYLQPMNFVELGTPPSEYPGAKNSQPASGEGGNNENSPQ